MRKVLDVTLGSAKTEIFLKMGLDSGINGLRRCSNHAARGASWPDGRRAGITVTVHLIRVCFDHRLEAIGRATSEETVSDLFD
jgi:hypothetical protein